jgi:anti-sigma regulatory factor (Ser/Thr protein kinase)
MDSLCARLAMKGRNAAWDAGRPVGLAAGRAVSFCLEPEPGQVARARELARAALARRGLGGHFWLAELIVSELVTNAIVHGAGPVRVDLSCGDGRLRVEVHDGHPRRPVRRQPSPDDEAGRGLALINGLIGLYGGEFDVADDDSGPGKSVRVIVCLPQDSVAAPDVGCSGGMP